MKTTEQGWRAQARFVWSSWLAPVACESALGRVHGGFVVIAVIFLEYACSNCGSTKYSMVLVVAVMSRLVGQLGLNHRGRVPSIRIDLTVWIQVIDQRGYNRRMTGSTHVRVWPYEDTKWIASTGEHIGEVKSDVRERVVRFCLRNERERFESVVRLGAQMKIGFILRWSIIKHITHIMVICCVNGVSCCNRSEKNEQADISSPHSLKSIICRASEQFTLKSIYFLSTMCGWYSTVLEPSMTTT